MYKKEKKSKRRKKKKISVINTKDVDRTRWRRCNYASKVSGITNARRSAKQTTQMNTEWWTWHVNVWRYHAGKHKLKIPFTCPCQNEYLCTLTGIGIIDTFELLLVVWVKLYLNDIRLLHKHAVFPLVILHHNTTNRTMGTIIHKFTSQKHGLENVLYNTQ